jgi:hypothetical protein
MLADAVKLSFGYLLSLIVDHDMAPTGLPHNSQECLKYLCIHRE